MEGFLVQMALDIGHSAKNLKKKVIAAGKEFPQMRGYGERTQRDFRTLVKNHHNNPELILYVIMTIASRPNIFLLLMQKLLPISLKYLTTMHSKLNTSMVE